MNQTLKEFKYSSFTALAISFVTIFMLFTWQGDKGFNLWDEGFLWYGVQQVLMGEVPIRDFMAYDPGRYYWSAAFLSISGDSGIMSLRAAVALFQALGLYAALLMVSQSIRVKDRLTVLFLATSAAILVLWMFPRHKLFDISLSIFLIGILTYLISNPVPKRYILAGVALGLVAVFGRNHGVYGAVGSIGVIAWLRINNTTCPGFMKGLLLLGIGVIVGFIPIIIMSIFIPGFATSFWESVRFLFEQKATNLPLPVPWPWTVSFSTKTFPAALRSVNIGLFFIATLIFGVLSLSWVIQRKIQVKETPPVLVAAAFLAIPYTHYAFSRADLAHLAQGIFPLLIGTLTIASGTSFKIKWFIVISLLTTSFWVMHTSHPGWYCFTSELCTNVEVSGSTLQVPQGTAADIALIRQLADDYAPDGRSFIATPFWPGAYALLERRSPMWEIYALFPRQESFEKNELERIKASKPGFVFILDYPLDGRDELRFKNTHPLIYRYILNNYEPVPSPNSSAYQIYKARNTGQ